MASKIAMTTWKVGGNTFDIIGVVPSITYQNEVVNPVSTYTRDGKTEYTAKIGLMYISDYGFAADPSVWTLTMSNYNNTIAISTNWLYMGLNDWTITRNANNSLDVFYVYSEGQLIGASVRDFALSIRPSFSLLSSVTYASGSGTQSDPVIIGN